MPEKRQGDEKRFYPDYLSEVLFVAFLTIELVLALAMLFPQALGRQIDFSAQYRPKPEWYFLWLFEILRYFPGKTAFIGAVVIPVLFIALLIFIPYVDRGKGGRIRSAIVAAGLLLTFLAFTIISALSP
jgi:cytochrome b6-f complex subunit 4